MGAVYSAKGSCSIGFMLLSGLALAGCVCAYVRMRTVRPSADAAGGVVGDAAGDATGGGGVRVGGAEPGPGPRRAGLTRSRPRGRAGRVEIRGPPWCPGRYDRPLHPIVAVRRRHR